MAIFVLATAHLAGKSNFISRSVPSMRTWGLSFPHLFFVLEDTREALVMAEHLCKGRRVRDSHVKEWECGPRAAVVTIAPGCTGEYHGAGPCCKCQFAIDYLFQVRPSLARDISWLGFMDDGE